MKLYRYILLAALINSCNQPTCNVPLFQDEFKDSRIVRGNYTKCSLYEIENEVRSLASEFYFDEYGRTDSIINFINSPDRTYFEIYKFGSDNRPYLIQQYALRTNDSISQNQLLFEAVFDSTKKQNIERIYTDGILSNFSVFDSNEMGQNISLRVYSADSSLISFTKFEYNQNAQVVKSEKFDPDSLKLGERLFTYKYSNSVATSEETYIADTLYSVVRREFADCHNMRRETEISNGQETTVESSFNNEGLPDGFIITGFNGWPNKSWVYEYE